MTRENKLALIIGFGLVLVMGVLISDHFSDAQTRNSADFSAGESDLLAGRLTDPELLLSYDRHDGADSTPASGQPVGSEGISSPAGADQRQTPSPRMTEIIAPDQATLVNRGSRPLGSIVPSSGQTPRSFKLRSIGNNESLYTICRDEYGDGNLWPKLHEFNADRIKNPNTIRAGIMIRIPPKSELLGTPAGTPDRPSTVTPQAPQTGYVMHTVKKDENLSKIAKKYLGSYRKYLLLYELNRDVLSNPDVVPEGTVIRVPRSG